MNRVVKFFAGLLAAIFFLETTNAYAQFTSANTRDAAYFCNQDREFVIDGFAADGTRTLIFGNLEIFDRQIATMEEFKTLFTSPEAFFYTAEMGNPPVFLLHMPEAGQVSIAQDQFNATVSRRFPQAFAYFEGRENDCVENTEALKEKITDFSKRTLELFSKELEKALREGQDGQLPQ